METFNMWKKIETPAVYSTARHQHGLVACTVYGDCTVCSCRHSKTSACTVC